MDYYKQWGIKQWWIKWWWIKWGRIKRGQIKQWQIKWWWINENSHCLPGSVCSALLSNGNLYLVNENLLENTLHDSQLNN